MEYPFIVSYQLFHSSPRIKASNSKPFACVSVIGTFDAGIANIKVKDIRLIILYKENLIL
jgi:hypothetical protein